MWKFMDISLMCNVYQFNIHTKSDFSGAWLMPLCAHKLGSSFMDSPKIKLIKIDCLDNAQ